MKLLMLSNRFSDEGIRYREINGKNIRYRDSGKTVARARLEKLFGHKRSLGSVVHHNNRTSNLWAFRSQEKHHRYMGEINENMITVEKTPKKK